MTVSAILFDAQGVIYERPALGVALQTLLDHYGLKPRHPTVVHNALRAASFDANIGRIGLDEYYNAVLRIHGVTEDPALAAGREALRFDATRLNLPGGTAASLRKLKQLPLSLGAFANSPYQASDEAAWLARQGIPSDTWAVFVSSCEVGALAPEPLMMETVLKHFDEMRDSLLLVSQQESILQYAIEGGLMAVAYQPDKQITGVRYTIDDLSQLLTLVSTV